jgi:hypothetical protein
MDKCCGMLCTASTVMSVVRVLQYGRCMKGFEINIDQTWFTFDLEDDTQCKKIPVLSYNNNLPGPLMISNT